MRPIAFVKRLLEVRSTLRARTSAMKAGRYRVTDRWAAHADARHPAWLLEDRGIEARSHLKRRLKSPIFALLGTARLSTHSDAVPGMEIFRGDLLFMTRNGQAKLFDYEHRMVLTFASAMHPMGPRAHRHLPSPRTLAKSPDDQWTAEEFVTGTPVTDLVQDDRERAVGWIFRSHVKHVETVLGDRVRNEGLDAQVDLADLLARAHQTPEFRPVVTAVREWMDGKDLVLPIVHSHGDLCFKNIVLSGDRWVVLDWEYAGPHSIMYDALNWMLVEAADHGDLRFVRLYLAGAYDEWLNRLCHLAGDQSSPPRRVDLFCCFLLERLVLRYASRPRDQRATVARKYAGLLRDLRQAPSVS